MYQNKSRATLNSYTFSTNVQRLFQFRLLKIATELEVSCVGVHFFVFQLTDGNREKRFWMIVPGDEQNKQADL